MHKIRWLPLAAALLLFLPSLGCGEEKTHPAVRVETVEVDTSPVEIPDHADLLLELYAAEVAPESDFTVSEVEGGVSIDRYNGKAAIIRVPSELDGKPVVAVGESAFMKSNVTRVVELPATVASVGAFAFYQCKKLEWIDGLSSVRSFGNYALSETALSTVSFGAEAESFGFGLLAGCDKLVALSLPFVGATRTEHTYLGYLFGAEYPEFSKGTYPPTLARAEVYDGCPALGDSAFYQCENLREVVLGEGISSVGVRCFDGCLNLWAIDLPDSVKSIRENAFIGCRSLTSVRLGTGLETMGINCFLGCISLSAVTLPDGLRSLPASCFSGCTALREIDLGGVREVGKNAFHNCVSLEKVTAKSDVTFAEGNSYAKDLI